MPTGFTFDAYRIKNERLLEEYRSPFSRLFETFLQFLVRQLRNNGFSIRSKIRLLAGEKRSEQVVHLHTGRKSIDSVAVISQVRQIKTDKTHIFEQGRQDRSFASGKLDNLREKDLLGSTSLLPDVCNVLVEQDTDMGTVLIDQSQT